MDGTATDGTATDGTTGAGDGLVDLPTTGEWQALTEHFEVVRHRHLRQLRLVDGRVRR